MKHLLIAICCFISHFAFSQSSNQLHTIKPKWKLGDTKKVHSKSFTKIFIKDSLFNSTEATANYSIKVTDTTKYYTLLYGNEPNSFDITSNSSNAEVDSAISFITTITRRIDHETKLFQYEMLVDKANGKAMKIKNSDKLMELIETIAGSIIDEYGVKAGKNPTQLDSIKQKVISTFKLKEPKIVETILNEFNYILNAYSMRFPYNASFSQKALVHDINAMGEFGDIEMPAIITTSSKKQDSSLIVEINTDYDKNFLLAQIKKKYKNLSNLTVADIFLTEKTVTSFTTVTNWIVSQKSSVLFNSKEVKVVNETEVTFQ